MKAKTITKYFLLVTTALLLGACGTQKPEKTASQEAVKTTSSSKPKQTSTASTTTTTEKTSTKATEKESPTTSVPATTEANKTNQTAGASTPSAPTNSSINIQGLADGDFSSIAGTWVNDLGETLVFDEKGLVSETLVISLDKIEEGRIIYGNRYDNLLQ